MSQESTAQSMPSIPEDAQIASTIQLGFLNTSDAPRIVKARVVAFLEDPLAVVRQRHEWTVDVPPNLNYYQAEPWILEPPVESPDAVIHYTGELEMDDGTTRSLGDVYIQSPFINIASNKETRSVTILPYQVDWTRIEQVVMDIWVQLDSGDRTQLAIFWFTRPPEGGDGPATGPVGYYPYHHPLGDDPTYRYVLRYFTVDGGALHQELPPSEQDWRVLPPTLAGDESAG